MEFKVVFWGKTPKVGPSPRGIPSAGPASRNKSPVLYLLTWRAPYPIGNILRKAIMRSKNGLQEGQCACKSADSQSDYLMTLGFYTVANQSLTHTPTFSSQLSMPA